MSNFPDRPPLDPAAPSKAGATGSIDALDALVTGCSACPRLVEWREAVAVEKRASFRDQEYWGRAIPGFGDPDADVLVVGLAPAAHGANRTGRMFTGDRSGDFLYAGLHRAGFANQPYAHSLDDGLQLFNARITAPVHCAPPANKPTPEERRRCSPFLARELELVNASIIVVLGGFGWQAVLASLTDQGWAIPRPRPRFGHGVEVTVDGPGDRSVTLLGCFHVSQQNTFTGRLTPQMLDDVLDRARELTTG